MAFGEPPPFGTFGALLGGNPAQQLGGPWGFGEQRAWRYYATPAALRQQLYGGTLSAEDKRRIAEAGDGQCVPIGPLPALRRESEAVRCYLKNLCRIMRAFEKVEGWTISEVRVPSWLVDDLRRHPWLRRSDRAFCENGREALQVNDEICLLLGTPLVVGTDRTEFSYKEVA